MFTVTSLHLISPHPRWQLLSQVSLEDPKAPTMLSQTGFPSPWQTLRSALQWYMTASPLIGESLLKWFYIHHRNQGFLSDKLTLDLQPLPAPSEHTSSSEVPPGHQFECILRCGGEGDGGGEGVKEVRVTCTGKKDGQTAAAQAMLKVPPCHVSGVGLLISLILQKLHPYITNWGSLLKLYSHPPPTAVVYTGYYIFIQ